VRNTSQCKLSIKQTIYFYTNSIRLQFDNNNIKNNNINIIKNNNNNNNNNNKININLKK